MIPALVSVPHAGLGVPPEVEPLRAAPDHEIARDGDEEAAAIYDLERHVARFITTGVARAVVDLNRAPDDRRRDGVVKTHTCWNVPVWRRPLADEVARLLVERYWTPYHEHLTALARTVPVAFDCHTMAAVAPPVAPDPGSRRPEVCLGDANGASCPPAWTAELTSCFGAAFGIRPAVNRPFSGGYITRRHGREMPWIQIEIARGPWTTVAAKRDGVRDALGRFCERFQDPV